jgi:serine protease Do
MSSVCSTRPCRRRHLSWFAAWVLGLIASATATHAQGPDLEAQSRALQRASAAVVGVRAVAVDDARSNRTLGRERQGSGIVIEQQGLVLTIGYLILEADQVQLVTDDERVIPGRVVGYDVATGFGLVQALAPLRIDAVPLGESGRVSEEEPLMIASGGEAGAVSVARLVSRRPFAGYWEYHIDGALFTSPPRPDHSGAGLFNGRGELVGVGSLIVTYARGDKQPRTPGNMFVPVDLLRPVYDELKRSGTTAASRRAWIGINCAEDDGQVRVVRVNDDSPADVAGLQQGDRILRIDGVAVTALGELWHTLWRGGPPEREITLEIQREDKTETLKVYSVDRAKTLKRAQGI